VVAWHPGVKDAVAERATASVCDSLRVRGVAAKVGLAGETHEDYRVEVRRRPDESFVFRIVHERDGVELSAARIELATPYNVEEYAPALVQELLGPPRTRALPPPTAAPMPAAAPVTPVTPPAKVSPVGDAPSPGPKPLVPKVETTRVEPKGKPSVTAPPKSVEATPTVPTPTKLEPTPAKPEPTPAKPEPPTYGEAAPPVSAKAAPKAPVDAAIAPTTGAPATVAAVPKRPRAGAAPGQVEAFGGDRTAPYASTEGSAEATYDAPERLPKQKEPARSVHTGTYFGGGVFYGGAAGMPSQAAIGLDLALFYEGEHFSVGPEYRYVKGGESYSASESSTSHQFHVMARGFFGPSHLLYAGGGLGYVSLAGDPASNSLSSTYTGSGIGLAGVFGLELFRQTKVRLMFEVRLDLPFFSVENTEYSSTSAGYATRTSYAVPLALSCLFMF
jgi:hypothetical protein